MADPNGRGEHCRMWRRIELKNYRSIESARVELAPFTVLVGPNGSGKSNFADALVFVSELGDASAAVARRGGITAIYRWQRVTRGELSIDLRLARSREDLDRNYFRYYGVIGVDREGRWSFEHEEMTSIEADTVQFSATRNEKHELKISTQSGGSLIVRLAETASAALIIKQLAMLNSSRPVGIPYGGVHRYRLNPEEMRQPRPDSNDPFLTESGSNIAEAIEQLRNRKDNSLEDVRSSMSQLVPGLVEIAAPKVGHFRTLEFSQRQVEGGVANFTAMEMSDGALRALGILVAAKQMDADSSLIIEEPEVHLHPGATAVLFEVLKQASERGAVLITTHSPELLDAAKDEEILVCDYRSGVTRIGPLASEQRQVVRDGLFSVAELMRTTPLRIEGDAPAVIDPHQTP